VKRTPVNYERVRTDTFIAAGFPAELVAEGIGHAEHLHGV
jgi:hypothetical protein